MSRWSVYMLVNSRGRTYIGATTDIERRLRQHNGHIRGGAKSTRDRGPWITVALLSGFENRSSAYRWEKIIKSRCRGFQERMIGFVMVGNGHCPEYKKRGDYVVPPDLTLFLLSPYTDMLNGGDWP